MGKTQHVSPFKFHDAIVGVRDVIVHLISKRAGKSQLKCEKVPRVSDLLITNRDI